MSPHSMLSAKKDWLAWLATPTAPLRYNVLPLDAVPRLRLVPELVSYGPVCAVDSTV